MLFDFGNRSTASIQYTVYVVLKADSMETLVEQDRSDDISWLFDDVVKNHLVNQLSVITTRNTCWQISNS